MRKDTTVMLPEKYCPECHGLLGLKVVHSTFGAATANVYCKKCNLIGHKREAPEITRGKALEKDGVVSGLHCMDKRITSLPCDVQIGILRQRMHPKGTEVYTVYCKKCDDSLMQYERKDGKYKCSVCRSINSGRSKLEG